MAQMRWIVRLNDAGSSSIIVDVTTFASAQETVFRTLRELLPADVARVGSKAILFEGRCFRGAAAPSVFVISEPTFHAFNSAVASFLPGTTPTMSVVFDETGSSKKSQPETILPAAAASRNEDAPSPPAPASRSGNRVLDRLNNIKKSYSSMTSSGSSTTASPLHAPPAAASTPTPNKRAPPPPPSNNARYEDATVSSNTNVYSSTMTPPKASSERLKYQRQLEEAEEEDRLAEEEARRSRQQQKQQQPQQHPSHASPQRFPSQATVQLMVWGVAVGRGVPVPFNPWQPPTLSLLMSQASALLEQPVHQLSFRKESEELEVDLEDDSDVQLLASEVLKSGPDDITVNATQRPSSSPTASAASSKRLGGETPSAVVGSNTPVSYVQLRREVRKNNGNNNKSGNTSVSHNNVTPLTSPIKEVNAPSPPPPPRNPFASGASVATGRPEYPKPHLSLVEHLD
ncbi:Hypothetical protein, putative [Bodo saltans]|uniref:Uncharacterized protein n=1 Tax=Bodo saltans TaxID=75058 RepID=A0A0S4JN92_BODSA|nr:Hypothetical protein, putative [Bodo saltans]|eukprot:CUG91685.1 Hypothetical protein, putative [Bodo saltans]